MKCESDPLGDVDRTKLHSPATTVQVLTPTVPPVLTDGLATALVRLVSSVATKTPDRGNVVPECLPQGVTS